MGFSWIEFLIPCVGCFLFLFFEFKKMGEERHFRIYKRSLTEHEERINLRDSALFAFVITAIPSVLVILIRY